MQKLNNQQGSRPYFPYSLDAYFSKNEFPKELPKWRDAVEDSQNPGLALRWVKGIQEIKEVFSKASCYDMA